MVATAKARDATVEALERLEQRLARMEERMESTIARLDGATAQIPTVVATVTDIIDGLVARLAERGVDVDERLRALVRAADHLTSPRALDALASVLQSDILAHQTTEVIGRVGRAVVKAEREAEPIGPWRLFRSLKDPEVQRAAGFLISVARTFGAELGDIKQLPAGGDS